MQTTILQQTKLDLHKTLTTSWSTDKPSFLLCFVIALTARHRTGIPWSATSMARVVWKLPAWTQTNQVIGLK